MNNLKQLLRPDSIVNNNNNNNDTYCLRWTRHPNMLCSALEESSHLVRTTDQPGLDLVVHLDDGGAVHLHSLVLAASSQYFNTLGQQQTGTGSYHLILPETRRADLMLVLRFLYTGECQVPAARLSAVTDIATALGVSSLITALGKTVKAEHEEKKVTSVSPTYFELRSLSPVNCSPSRSVSPPSVSAKRSSSPISESVPSKAMKLESLPMLQSILTQFQLGSPLLPPFQANLALKDKDNIHENFPNELGYFGGDLKNLEALGKLKTFSDPSERDGGSPYAPTQLASLLTAAAKLKQVAEQAVKCESQSSEGQRKLAFHEPRPCPVCRRMYRDAATLRTHTAIMHSEGSEPFRCSCGVAFGTKYEMYQHKKAGHPPVQ